MFKLCSAGAAGCHSLLAQVSLCALQVSLEKYSLRPYHPGHARSPLIPAAQQGRAWFVLGWQRSTFPTLSPHAPSLCPLWEGIRPALHLKVQTQPNPTQGAVT